MSTALTGVKRFVLWDYPRAGWQYDVLVILILIFVFATPRNWFHDQPRPSSVVMLPSEQGQSVYWMDPGEFQAGSDAELRHHAESLIRKQTGKKIAVSRLEPIFDSEKDVRGYMAFVTP